MAPTPMDLPLVAMDWSARGVHVTFDGSTVEALGSVEDLLERLPRPHRIVTEASFESWDAVRRSECLTRINNAGHELLVFRSIHTARQRRPDEPKSDETDARVIYRIAREGRTHVHRPPEVDLAWTELRARANAEYQRMRVSGAKDELAAAAASILGEYHDLESEAQQVLGNGKRYSKTLLAAIYFAATRVTSRDDFERLLGLHGSAYPSLLRSEVHHHSFRHARRRGVTWTAYRRQLRRAYALLKGRGVSPA